MGADEAEVSPHIEPSIRNALPHYLPLGIFPLIFLAALHGGWWLVPAFLFMSVAGPLDRVLGRDGRNMDPAKTPQRRLLWHNLPVWGWALLWPPTLIFGLWQILVANPFAIWEDVALAIILTMEAQAVFVVGHELVHRRSTWERRLGEFLLSSASYPQYATEHVYIHHAKVGTPHDVGSAPKGESFWRYFPREIVSNLTNSWKVSGERLARRRLSRWHYTNPFWRYGLGLAFWYGLVFWMGGHLGGAGLRIPRPVLRLLDEDQQLLSALRPAPRAPAERPAGIKVMPRHSWSADWKFSNWMFFNMQRHADHHAMATRHYPLLQVHDPGESPELPGTYGDMMNIVLRPKRWFEKMDPLVDRWRGHFYPEIDDWSAYDSPIAAARPDAFEAIVEIFGAAPRLAGWIERNPELLDNLKDREFTDLDLPKGFMSDREAEAIARRGLARLYWTLEMGVREMKELIAELPMADAGESAEIVRNWSNDKAFQVGMHVVRGNLLPREAQTALSNLAEASISSVLAAVVADFIDRNGPLGAGGAAAIALGDLASREAYPGMAMEVMFVHDGSQTGENDRLCERFREALSGLAQHSLLFSPNPVDANSQPALPLSELAGHCANPASGEIPALTRARCVFECGDSDIGGRFGEARHGILAECGANASLIAGLREPPAYHDETAVFTCAHMSGALQDIERAARYIQLKDFEAGLDAPAPTAAELFNRAGVEPLAQAATLCGAICRESRVSSAPKVSTRPRQGRRSGLSLPTLAVKRISMR